MNKIKLVNPILKPVFMVALALPLMAGVEVTIVDSQQAQAQEENKPRRKAKRVESIRQKHIKFIE